jgi:hypothetical protein
LHRAHLTAVQRDLCRPDAGAALRIELHGVPRAGFRARASHVHGGRVHAGVLCANEHLWG